MVHAVSGKWSFRRRARASLAAPLLALALGACAEREAYETALETDSIPAFRDYVEAYPDGKFVDEAYERMEELYFQSCLAKGTPEGIDLYLKEFPSGRFVDDAEAARSGLTGRFATAGIRTRGSKRKTIATKVRFLENRTERLRYKELLDRGLPIGSGVVEAACKTLASQLIKRSG